MVEVILLGITPHQSKRVTKPILSPRTRIHLLNLPMHLTNTILYYYLHFHLLVFNSEGVLDFGESPLTDSIFPYVI
jgi:hypothetical protein